MGKTITKNDLEFDNKIILKSVYGKGDLTYYIQTTPDPKTGLYASCVRKVNSDGDMFDMRDLLLAGIDNEEDEDD